MTTHAEAQAIADAQRARAALDVLTPVLAVLREAAIEKWAQSPLEQQALREKLYLSVSTIGAIERAIKRMVDEGKSAEVMRDHAELLGRAMNALAVEGVTRP